MDAYWELSDFDIHTRQKGLENLLKSFKGSNTTANENEKVRSHFDILSKASAVVSEFEGASGLHTLSIDERSRVQSEMCSYWFCCIAWHSSLFLETKNELSTRVFSSSWSVSRTLKCRCRRPMRWSLKFRINWPQRRKPALKWELLAMNVFLSSALNNHS